MYIAIMHCTNPQTPILFGFINQLDYFNWLLSHSISTHDTFEKNSVGRRFPFVSNNISNYQILPYSFAYYFSNPFCLCTVQKLWWWH